MMLRFLVRIAQLLRARSFFRADSSPMLDRRGSGRSAACQALTGCLMAVLFSTCPATSATADSVADPGTLSAGIRDYLTTQDPDKADSLLAGILGDPQATVETVAAIVKMGWFNSTGPAHPVGLQPSLPVSLHGQTYRYGLYVPPSYQPTKDYALVLCLHGAGFTGDAYLERWQQRLGDAYILACPTYMQGSWWTRHGEELVLAVLKAVQTDYRIDPDRIFLTGMSNGGIGTYLLGMHHAPLFAGIAPMAGGLDDVLMPFLANLRNTPAYIIHGRKDQVMPVELSRSIAAELARLGYPYHYQEHDRVHPMAGGHFFPREELPALVTWFNNQRRQPYPRRVTVVRDATHLIAFGWVRIDATDRIAAFTEALTDSRDEAIVNRVYARLDAEITGPNRIEVRASLVNRYSLFLNQQLVDLSQPVTIVTNGRMSYQGMLVPTVETLLRDARQRRDRLMLFPVLLHISVEEAS